MVKLKTATTILFIALIINSGIALYLASTYQECEVCEMRFNVTEGTINGYYNVNNYFCVWTKGRTANEIAETTFHELAHYYSYEDIEHFKAETEEST